MGISETMAEFTLNGIMLSVPDAMLTPRLRAKLSDCSYEAQEAAAAMRRVGPGRRVLDLGAGVGYVACLCAREAGAQHIVTVEANPAMLEVVRGNLDRNGFQESRVFHGAVAGERNGAEQIDFDLKKEFWGARLAEGDTAPDRVTQVPLMPLSQLMRHHRPNVVIMDIEGAEQELFDTPWPGYVRNVILELHPKRYDDICIKRIVDCMSASGLTYDHLASCGKILAFRRVTWGK